MAPKIVDDDNLEARYPLCEDPGVPSPLPPDLLDRAQGCLLGQVAGDSLGSLVEFQSAAALRRRYPNGLTDLADGGTWGTIAGQPTDDSEMALILARAIIAAGRYDPDEAAVAYACWFGSDPFDRGRTITQALGPALDALVRGEPAGVVAEAARLAASRESQANGALMRISPLAIYAHALPADEAAGLARQDAVLTHPHPVCQDANAVFVVAIAHAVAEKSGPEATFRFVADWAWGAGPTGEPRVGPEVRQCLENAQQEPPADFQSKMGWVLVALQNSFWQMLHAPSLEAGISDTVMRGGDTDSNAAIAGALLGAVRGVSAVPARWRDKILSCRPENGRPGVRQPRPRPFWPVDVLLLARRLAELSG